MNTILTKGLWSIMLILSIIIAGCTTPAPTTSSADVIAEPVEVAGEIETTSATLHWRDITLHDIRTGTDFVISDFAGKSVLLETFAVWCPFCKKQQDQITLLHEELGDSVVSISLDADPNEDEAKVKDHIEKYGYDWFFTIDNDGFTKQLVDEFGINVVNAPSTPIILICENQEYRLLGFGIKSWETLKAEIDKGCEA